LTHVPSLQSLAQISEERIATTFKESPLKRTKRSGLFRNVGIAQENHARETSGRAS
jgi:epoxyqueuosine reductase QueG